MERLWRVVTRTFVAGFVTNAEGRVTHAAPLLQFYGIRIGRVESMAVAISNYNRWDVQEINATTFPGNDLH